MQSRTFVYLARDLFFAVRIQDTTAHHGWTCVRWNGTSPPADLLDHAEPDVVLVDLNAPRDQWQALISAASSVQGGPLPTIAFGSHMDLEARQAARDLGATAVVANSRLSADLPGLLARYATTAPRRG